MGIIACKEPTKKENEQITKERRASALEKSGLEGEIGQPEVETNKFFVQIFQF
jgi:hypothetical protein